MIASSHTVTISQAGPQNSDLVSGNGPTKKRKRTLEDESKSDGEDKDFKLGDTDTELYQLSEAVRAFIETTFKSRLVSNMATMTFYLCQIHVNISTSPSSCNS